MSDTDYTSPFRGEKCAAVTALVIGLIALIISQVFPIWIAQGAVQVHVVEPHP